MKQCSKCAEFKSLEEFGNHRRTSDGKQGCCKACKRLVNAAYYRRNKGAQKRRVRRWRESNPAIRATESANKAARKAGVKGRLTVAQVTAVFGRWPRCLRCGSRERLSLDHVVPLSQGGPNTPENLQVLCISCNARKRTRTADHRDSHVLSMSYGGQNPVQNDPDCLQE